jgi:PAS domain S-box-containing protein
MTNGNLGQILVVDDEVELKRALVETLNAQGYAAVGYSSGTDALAALRERNFDVLLSDMMMPGMDGIALLGAALEIDPHLICIIMTGQGTIQTAVDAMRVGAFDYLLKPFRLQSLMPTLTRALNVRHLRLENLQLRETVAIHELSQTIASTLDPHAVITKLADAALQQSDADEVSVLLPTPEGDELYVAAVRGENRLRLIGERIPMQKSISSWVARELTPLLLEGQVNDQRFTALWPRPDIRSAISVPLQVAGKLIGILNINSVNRARPFTSGQMKALTILANTAAVALESAALYEQVRRTEQNYRSIFENAVEGIFQSTFDGGFITVNPSMARILGYDSPEEVIATITDIKQQLYVDPECRAKANRIQEERGILHAFEFEVYRKDGEKIWLSLNRRTARDGNGSEPHYEGSIEDITGRKRAEEALRLSEEKLRQSQKLEAVGQLAGGVAHDFNNLLTVINGYSDLLMRKLEPNSPIRLTLEEIKHAGERAASLTRQLLAFSRRQVLQPEVLKLNVIVANVDKMLSRLIGEDINLLTVLEPMLGQIKADPGQIEQVLLNLAVNARDAMPQGGKLTIETANVYLDGQYSQSHTDIRPGHYVMLAMSDSGCGMTPETQAHIFEPFYTTKEQGKGTGLGLSTVYGIVKQSGGNLWVYSEVGYGTTFKLYLPCVDELNETDETHAALAEPVRGRETVLLAEDEEQVRRMARTILEMYGYHVLEASNGNEAVSIYKEHGDEIDMLLTDAVMPQMSGRELREVLVSLRPDIKVLYMSGYTDDAIMRHGLLEQEIVFLQKPFTAEALVRKVREVLDAPHAG